jgi:hypothetical protein
MRGRVVIVARDAGAAAALAPVARALIRDGLVGVSIVAYGKAASVFETRCMPVLAFPEEPSDDQIESLLTRERAPLLLTGTSLRPGRDAMFWQAAARLRIPAIALLDHWCNYAERFTDQRPFDCLPDTIAVMDDAAAEELRRQGCPPERLLVTGQPHFDDLVRDSSRLSRAEVRRELGVGEEQTLLVFASEPQARFYGSSADDPRFLGYTEHDSLAAVLDAAAAVAPHSLVLVKLHPLDATDAFAELADCEPRLETRTIRAYPTEHLVAAADVVLGMTSVFLLEAVLTGVPTISVRPNGGDDHFLAVHADKIVSVTDVERLSDVLAGAVGAAQRGMSGSFDAAFGERAIERVVAAIYERAAPLETETTAAK